MRTNAPVTGRSSSSGAERDEELVQLPERLAQSLPEADALVGGLLRRMELVQDQQRLAPLLLEGHRGDGLTALTLLVGPDEARGRCHLEVLAEERHRLRALEAEHEAVTAPDTDIRLARE